MKKLELSPEQLKKICLDDILQFETTADVTPLEGIVGQERAVKALEFGLRIRKSGYNIFITGVTGTGRNSYTHSLLKTIAKREKAPEDLCYVYNFDKPDQPRAVRLKSGQANDLAEDVNNLIQQVSLELPKVFTSEGYGKNRTLIMQLAQEKQNEILEALNEKGREMGFLVKNTDNGLIAIPLDDKGKPMDEEHYSKLSKEKAKEIEEKSRKLNMLILDAVKGLRELDRDARAQVEKLENDMADRAMEENFAPLLEKYVEYPVVLGYFRDMRADLLKNAREFKAKDDAPSTMEMLFMRGDRSRDFLHKYQVNILVDNGKTAGAPIVTEPNPTYYNLVGKTEYENSMGVLNTDYTKIKAGALHRANGGYLVLQSLDLLTNSLAWTALKRALKTGRLQIENISEQVGVLPTSSLKPEPVPLDVKVIMIGNYQEYQLLYQYDEDFRKLFKIKADFDVEMECTQENVGKLCQFISNHCTRENLRHFTRKAAARLVEYSSRLAESQDKLSTRFNELVELIYEADTWAEIEECDTVDEKHVSRAIREKIYRSNKYEMKLQEMIEKGVIMIDTQAQVMGQVNGLAVLDVGEYAFGKPSRITVNTYVGRKGIINIEREAKLSGAIHDKGVLILSGYLGEKFGGKRPLSFSASICFEQNYDGVDGDSASSTELYALLSSLSGVPIRQSIAVTGSVNQKGMIQPIGGVNHKIEGFFQVCKAKGLTGEHGVMIPRQNITNLMLDDEVIAAVREGKFHIYGVSTIEEGIEILTGKTFPEITELIEKRCERMHELLKKEKDNE